MAQMQMQFDGIKEAAKQAVIDGVEAGLAEVSAKLVGATGTKRAPVLSEDRVPLESKPAKRSSKASPKAPEQAKRASARAPVSGGRKGEKRSPEALAQLTEQLYNHVKANHGQGVEALAKGLACGTKELSLPLKKLLADGKIKTTGQKRATRYFPA